jgi:putative SOS response-associated peptidase YedK
MAWKMINARAETVTTAPAFKKAFEKRRCLLPVDGFFEWKKVGKEKRTYMIAMANGEAFTLAGLWENWKDPDSGEWVRTVHHHQNRRERTCGAVPRPYASRRA